MDAMSAVDDDDDRAGQEERSREVAALFPVPDDGMLILGGFEVGIAFQEARLAYVHGLWLSTIFNAAMAIERHIAASLHGVGVPVRSLTFPELTAKAEQLDYIDHYQRTKYDELHKLRDDYARFREPIDLVERLAEEGRMGIGINELLQADARMALTLACGYFEKNCHP
jgi:hypothetical protein